MRVDYIDEIPDYYRLIIDRGELQYLLYSPDIFTAAYADSAIFTYSGNDIVRIDWRNDVQTEVLSLKNNISHIELSGYTLYITTRNYYIGFENSPRYYNFYGLYAYDTVNGRNVCLADETELYDANISAEADHHIVGYCNAHTINSKTVYFADHYVLMRFDREKFAAVKIADLKYENSEWRLVNWAAGSAIEGRYLFLQADKESDGYTDYKIWYDTKENKFLKFRPDEKYCRDFA